MCGLHCGFVMDTPIWFNPVDQALVYFSSYFPFDYAILVFLAVYLMLASIYGMVRLGIRIGGVRTRGGMRQGKRELKIERGEG